MKDTTFNQRIKINDVWYTLGGGQLQGLGNELRGAAFWRDSPDLNISINTEKNTWCDHAHGEHEMYGGTGIALIRIVLNCDRQEAIDWLETKRLTRKIPLISEDNKRPPRREPDAIYPYFYKDESLAFNVRQWDSRPDTKKICIPQYFIGNRWRNG